jgi:hypothetical protein
MILSSLSNSFVDVFIPGESWVIGQIDLDKKSSQQRLCQVDSRVESHGLSPAYYEPHLIGQHNFIYILLIQPVIAMILEFFRTL